MLTIMYFIGYIKAVQYAYLTLSMIKAHYFTKRLDLIERYGKGSWVIITGASDGIGMEYSK